MSRVSGRPKAALCASPSSCLWRLLSGLVRALLRSIWRILKSAAIWFVTESPLAEPRRSAHRPLLRLIPWLLLTAGWIAITLVSVASYYASILPDPHEAMTLNVPPNITIYARGGELIGERGMRRAYAAYKDISPNLVIAVLAAEDRRFFYHFGVDPKGLLRALSSNFRSGEVQQGGSTITQQLAKNLFLQPKRNLSRKAEEFVLALWLERRFTKQEILELYLNRVYFGGGNYGIGAAAYSYFGKEPKDITLAEAAILAGLIKAPSYYSPNGNMDRAHARAKTILRVLAESDQIDINQYAEAATTKVEVKTPPSKPGFGFVADWVAEVTPMLTSEARTQPDRRDDHRRKPANDRAHRCRECDAHQGAHRARVRGGGASAYPRWRDPGHDRRPQSRGEPVQPRGARHAAAGLGLQAVHLSRGNRERLHAQLADRRQPYRHRRMEAHEFRQRLSRADKLAKRAHPFEQHGGRAAGGDGWRAPGGGGGEPAWRSVGAQCRPDAGAWRPPRRRSSK